MRQHDLRKPHHNTTTKQHVVKQCELISHNTQPWDHMIILENDPIATKPWNNMMWNKEGGSLTTQNPETTYIYIINKIKKNKDHEITTKTTKQHHMIQSKLTPSTHKTMRQHGDNNSIYPFTRQTHRQHGKIIS